MRIAILTGTSPSWNPRVAKEAAALARSDLDVVVFGVSADQRRLEDDSQQARRDGYRYQSVAPNGPSSFDRIVRRLIPRLWGLLAGRLHAGLGVESRWQLGRFASRILKYARASGADYFIVHLEEAAWVGTVLLGEGRRVGVDFEDWYSEDLPPEVRRRRPIRLLRALEHRLLSEGSHTTCPSRAMSVALADEYSCKPPVVVYNAFPSADRASLDGLSKDRERRTAPSIYWFSQTLGAGRGLEDLLAALPFVRADVEVHLRGQQAQGFGAWLSERIPVGWESRVYIHEPVSNAKLLSRIVEHDIGFAGEMKYCRNKDLTVSNKILHYLLGGLAVVASDTAGQREVADQATDAVATYPSGDCLALAEILSKLLTSPEELRRRKAAALEAASRTFCWEVQEKILLETVGRALGRSLR